MRVVCRASLALLAGLAGCAHDLPPRESLNGGPAFDPIGFYTCHLWSNGIIDLDFSRPDHFKTDILGTPERGGLRLAQHFTYRDGHTQDRVWHLRQPDPTHLTGTADDVIGVAQGAVIEGKLHWRYALATEPGHWTHNILADQWIWANPDGGAVTRVRLSKLGLPIGTVREQFQHVIDLPGAIGADAARPVSDSD